MKSSPKKLFLFLLLLLLSSCKSQVELKGNIFIVTQGAENIKLGLVQVRAIPQEQITSFTDQRADFTKVGSKVSGEFRFSDLSHLYALQEATTDADGHFSMTLPAKGKVALVASGKRFVPGAGEEKYYWVVWVFLEQQKAATVTLSNNNMIPVMPVSETSDLMFIQP